MFFVELYHNDSNILRVARAHVWCVNACLSCTTLHILPNLAAFEPYSTPQPKYKPVPAFPRPSQI